jgi:4-hydroxy-3-polyprenylbenzoate decarboxylase
MKHLKDLREFISELEAVGEIQRIDADVDWNLEIGAIIRRSYDLRAPAPLFTNISGYEHSGFRVVGAPAALGAPAHPLVRIAVALGLAPDATGTEIIETVVAARDRPGIPPKYIATTDAPCKENVLRGHEVDLLRFPTPLIHANDGGRYIQTYGMNIVRTPDGSWTNWSVNRMMIAGKDRLACLIPPGQHLGMILAQWRELGEPMPIVLALGVEPALPLVGGMPLPKGVDESQFLGALLGEPIEVTSAESVNLPVPATAEIVIEGHIMPEETVMEGPMNEYPGYNATSSSPKPLFLVSAITYRDGAILPVVAAGPPIEEDHTVMGTMFSAELLYQFRSARLPVSSVWFSHESALHWLIVSMHSDWPDRYDGNSAELARRVGDVAFSGKPGFATPKVLLVEDDIDITDVNQVVWAFATRAHPEHGEVRFAAEPFGDLAVYLDEEERHTYKAAKVVHNCLLADRFPRAHRPVKGDLQHGWPREIQERVLRRWSEYGYGRTNGRQVKGHVSAAGAAQ